MRKTHESRPGLRNKYFNIPEKSTLKKHTKYETFQTDGFSCFKDHTSCANKITRSENICLK